MAMTPVSPMSPSSGKRSRSEFEDGTAGMIKADVPAVNAEGFPIYVYMIEHN